MPALTAKQKAFADAILAGKGPSDAYRGAYDSKGHPRVIASKAQGVMRHPAVVAYLTEQRAKLAEEDLLPRKLAVSILAKIATGKDRAQGRTASHRDKVSAIATASRILGYDSPQKVEVKVEGSLLHRIRSTAPGTT